MEEERGEKLKYFYLGEWHLTVLHLSEVRLTVEATLDIILVKYAWRVSSRLIGLSVNADGFVQPRLNGLSASIMPSEPVNLRFPLFDHMDYLYTFTC